MAASICSGGMTDELAYDDEIITRMRLAAEEVAWLTGRGYSLDVVGDVVAQHHGLDDAQRAALALGTCSEPQYRRRAARELEPEDVARRPLAIDAFDVLSAVETALAGGTLLQTLDGTVRALGASRSSWAPGPRSDDAIARVLEALRPLRPQMVRFYVDEGAANAADLAERITARSKAAKAKVEVVLSSDVRLAMRKERQIASADASMLDACGAWINLAGRVASGIPDAKIVRLQ